MRSLCQWIFARSLVGALAVIASAGCDRPVDALGKDHGYLAVRSTLGLPLSLPTTTGVPAPMPGGVLWPAG